MSRVRFGIVITGSIILVASYLLLLYTFFDANLSPVKTVITPMISPPEPPEGTPPSDRPRIPKPPEPSIVRSAGAYNV